MNTSKESLSIGLLALILSIMLTGTAFAGDPKVSFTCGRDNPDSYQIDFLRDDNRLQARVFDPVAGVTTVYDNCKLADYQTEEGMTGHMYCVQNGAPDRKNAILLGETGFTQYFFAKMTSNGDPQIGVSCQATNEYIFGELDRSLNEPATAE